MNTVEYNLSELRKEIAPYTPKIIAVTKCDGDERDFYKTLDALKVRYGTAICPVVIPFMIDFTVALLTNLAYGFIFAGSSTACMSLNCK